MCPYKRNACVCVCVCVCACVRVCVRACVRVCVREVSVCKSLSCIHEARDIQCLQHFIFHIMFVLTLNTGTPAKSSSAEVFVTIININDNAPKFGQESYSISVNESTAVGTTVLQVNASDVDSPVLTFSIESGNTDKAFSLKPLSGKGLPMYLLHNVIILCELI